MKSFFKTVVVSIITWEARLVLKKYKPKIVAITGSVGKTSTKDAVHAMLSHFTFARKTKKSLKELMQEFYNWLQECEEYTIMGQNVFFDKYFLEDSFKSSGIDFRFPHRIVDIHTLAFYVAKSKNIEVEIKNKKMNFSLRNIAIMLSLPTEPFPHNALTGAKYDAEIYMRLMFDKKMGLI